MNLFSKKRSNYFPATFPKSCAKVFFFWNWKTFWPMMLELAPAWLWEVPKASGLGNLTSKMVSKSKKNSLFVQNVQIGYSFKEKQLSSSEFSIRNVWVVGCPPSICKNWRSFAICQNKNRPEFSDECLYHQSSANWEPVSKNMFSYRRTQSKLDAGSWKGV